MQIVTKTTLTFSLLAIASDQDMLIGAGWTSSQEAVLQVPIPPDNQEESWRCYFLEALKSDLGEGEHGTWGFSTTSYDMMCDHLIAFADTLDLSAIYKLRGLFPTEPYLWISITEKVS